MWHKYKELKSKRLTVDEINLSESSHHDQIEEIYIYSDKETEEN